MLTAVTGINWGDEGKGRVIDLLAEHADVVARYQGGNNAGHTVVTEQGKFILNLLPSGILHPDVVCVLGAGMVIDLDHLAGEMDAIEERGVKVGPENLKLSDKATISMPWHKVQDGLEEDRLAQKGAAFGSTRRGIAYAYSDKYRKKTLRLGDLLHLDEKRVQDRLHMILESKNLELGGCYHQEPMSYDALLEWCRMQAGQFAPYICDVGAFLKQAHDSGKRYKTGKKSKDGAPLYKTIMEPDFTAHQLRHEFASVLVECQISPQVAKELMGHADILTTQRWYAEAKASAVDEATRILNAHFTA